MEGEKIGDKTKGMQDSKSLKAEQGDKIAKRAVKISLAALILAFVIDLVLLAVLLTQSDAMVQMSREIDRLSQELKELKKYSRPNAL